MSDQGEDLIAEEVKQVVDAIKAAVARLKALDDPAAQAHAAGVLLASWSKEQPALREIRQAAVRQLRADKVSYRQIAAHLDISVARVQQIESGETGRDSRAPAKKPAKPSGA